MTEERSLMIGEALAADVEETKRLLDLTPEEAAAELAKKGYDFTAEELIEFRNELQEAAKLCGGDGELDEEALSSISGGCSKCLQAGLWVVVGVIAVVW